MFKHITLSVVAAAAAMTVSSANAGTSNASFAFTDGRYGSATLLVNGTTTLTATSRGRMRETGSNNGGGRFGTYNAGVCGSSDACLGLDLDYRNYFTFDLSSITAPITSAVLQLKQPNNAANVIGHNGYISTAAALNYTLYDTDLTGIALNKVTGIAAFQDLGSGVVYGNTTVSAATNGTVVPITLNAAALSAMNNRSATNGLFSLGGAISAVPEPASWALMIGGFGLIGGAMRRRAAVRTTVSFA